MVAAAQRHGELIAHFSPKRAVLREAQMMGIGRPAAADQARMFNHVLDVVFIAKAARFGMDQLALIDTDSGCFPSGFWGPPLN